MTAPILEVRDVQQRYGDTVALHGVRFDVAEGEMFGLLGPNGAGKTTLLSILSCLLQPTGGSARILGYEVRPGNKELQRLIGIVPQDLALYGELTARENLAFFGELYAVRGAAGRQRVAEVLEMVGLADRALMHRPRLLMLDEPTTGVDPQSRNHIFEGVRRLNAEGMTIIYTSHYMEEVEALCRRIGIMDHGRLIACDTLPGLLRQLSGLIRFRVPAVTPALRDAVKSLPEVRLSESADGVLELECPDVKPILVQLVALLTEQNVALLSLETEEPNLERVFLHLTGHALRD
jgi:ABC-2 type transport system ATP-binding protein